MKHSSRGFTLIELIIVIVILGILAVTAAPRFIDMSSDARLAKLETLESGMRTASRLVHYKATIEDKLDCSSDPTIEMGGKNITLRCGYACPHPSGIKNAMDADEGFTWVGGNCAGQLGYIEVKISDAPDPNNCKVRYISARSTREARIEPTSSGC